MVIFYVIFANTVASFCKWMSIIMGSNDPDSWWFEWNNLFETKLTSHCATDPRVIQRAELRDSAVCISSWAALIKWAAPRGACEPLHVVSASNRWPRRASAAAADGALAACVRDRELMINSPAPSAFSSSESERGASTNNALIATNRLENDQDFLR